MSRVVAFLSCLAVVAGACPAAAEDLVLQPSSQWTVDYAEDSCALRRNFGEGTDVVILELRQFAPDGGFQIVVAGPSLKPRNRKPETAFLPDDDIETEVAAVYGNFANGMKGIVISDNLAPNAVALGKMEPEESEEWYRSEAHKREAEIAAYYVGKTFTDDLQLVTGSMTAPMVAMRACLDELLTHWGIDAAAHRTLTRRAAPTNFDDFARRIIEDYPRTMINQNKNGLVRVRLSINDEGLPTACHIQLDFPGDEFEKTACDKLMRYARFDPALDAAGQPIASYWTTAINYLLN